MPFAAHVRSTSRLVAAGVHTNTRSASPSGRSSTIGTVSMPSTGVASRLVAKTLALVAVGQDVVEGDEAELARVGRRAGHHHAAGIEQGAEVSARVAAHAATSTRASTATGTPSTTISGLRSADDELGVRLGGVGQPDEHVDQPLAVDGRLTPERPEQRLGGEVVDHVLGVGAVDRHQSDGHVGHGLGEDAADARP